MESQLRTLLVSCAALLCCPVAFAGQAVKSLEEFRVKRESVFEFAQKPRVTRDGDRVTIEFETKGLCDVTVAVESSIKKVGPGPQIVRHLACGVLGPNAPAPFRKDSKKQAIVWDGKDDQGRYVDDKENISVRVSLGLKPRFERTLFWDPKKRIAPGHRPNFAAAPEGVYVHEGGGVDHIRLFDHRGNYVRTVYPFVPDYSSEEARSGSPESMRAALRKVRGLKWVRSPMDGLMVPDWQGIFFHTMLTSGSNAGTGSARINPTKYGSAASAMAWTPGPTRGKPGYLALAMRRLNRVATDGTTGALTLQGPATRLPGRRDRKGRPTWLHPARAAFSPHGKWLYLLLGHSVARMEFTGDRPPEPFVGQPLKPGTDEKHLRTPSSIAVDAKGRLYVADYDNDRIQVFTESGKLYKSIKFHKPLRVFVSPRNGHIYVGSWLIVTRYLPSKIRLGASFTHLGPVDDPRKVSSTALPFASYSNQIFMNRTHGTHEIYMDFYADFPVLWVVPGSGDTTEQLMQHRRSYSKGQWHFSRWSACHYRLFVEKNGKLVETANFAKDVAEAVGRVDPPATPAHERQRLYVNPRDGRLYVMEGDTGVGKATLKLLRIDPETGKTREIRLPFATEEIAFDLDGMAYLRTDVAVARYDSRSWREVPYDYGEQMSSPGFNGGGRAISAIALPGSGKPGCFHLGGFAVSPKGNVVVSCYNRREGPKTLDGNAKVPYSAARPYTPPIFPGRARWAEVHIWDQHGKVVLKDAVPGLTMTDGLHIDKEDNIYALWAARRLWPGQSPSDNEPTHKGFLPVSSQTLVKFRSGKGKVLCSGRTDVSLGELRPKRPPDGRTTGNGVAWVEGAEWMYGGVGCNGFIPHWAPNCSCWNARPALDLFARSFATELARSRVAVLDSGGNLIMRIGKYGNVEDGVPLVKKGGPSNPRPVGGDEVALAKPAYLAAHTDRRLFIADYGNYRILSVKLGYHAEETLALKDVPDRAAAGSKK